MNNNSESAFQSFSREISTSLENWNLNRNLFGDPNENYNMLENIILQAKSKYLSPKTVHFKQYKHKISPWLTAGILQSIKCRDVLYRRLLSTPRESVQYCSIEQNLDTYKKLLKKTIRLAKAKYYFDRFEKNKSNIRHTWSTIKDILGKFKVKSHYQIISLYVIPKSVTRSQSRIISTVFSPVLVLCYHQILTRAILKLFIRIWNNVSHVPLNSNASMQV